LCSLVAAGVKDIIKPRIENYAGIIEGNWAKTKNSSPSIHPLTESDLVSSFYIVYKCLNLTVKDWLRE
jgi:hypothetical protein